jgi:hypothetical protein
VRFACLLAAEDALVFVARPARTVAAKSASWNRGNRGDKGDREVIGEVMERQEVKEGEYLGLPITAVFVALMHSGRPKLGLLGFAPPFVQTCDFFLNKWVFQEVANCVMRKTTF